MDEERVWNASGAVIWRWRNGGGMAAGRKHA